MAKKWLGGFLKVDFEIDTSGVKKAIELACGVVKGDGQKIALRTAEEATLWVKANHGYTDRTRNLTDSIRWRPVSVTDTKTECQIVAGGRDAPYAVIINDGSKAHKIYGEPTLRFEVAGEVIYAKSVNHPGTRPYGFMSQCYDKAARLADVKLRALAAKVESM